MLWAEAWTLEFNTNPASAYWSWHGPEQGSTWAAREPVLTAASEETVVSVVWKPRENSQKSQALIFPATEEHPD